jgi:hypothetical protein
MARDDELVVMDGECVQRLMRLQHFVEGRAISMVTLRVHPLEGALCVSRYFAAQRQSWPDAQE